MCLSVISVVVVTSCHLSQLLGNFRCGGRLCCSGLGGRLCSGLCGRLGGGLGCWLSSGSGSWLLGLCSIYRRRLFTENFSSSFTCLTHELICGDRFLVHSLGSLEMFVFSCEFAHGVLFLGVCLGDEELSDGHSDVVLLTTLEVKARFGTRAERFPTQSCLLPFDHER